MQFAAEKLKNKEERSESYASYNSALSNESQLQQQQQQQHQSHSSKNKKHISDFLIGTLLGEGAYARVHLCQLKSGDEQYAVKIMDKQFILKEDKANFVKMEKIILSTVDHPNIMRLYYSFHDERHLYMVMDFCHGGELLKVIQHYSEKKAQQNIYNRACSTEDARFYVASTIRAMQFLHSKGIIHRDIKPENILLTAKGHVKLTDFGTAKDEKRKDNRRNTFCGTAEYVSPEVLRDDEASVGADLWAVGCLLYQLLIGRPPFRGGSEYLTFQLILSHRKKQAGGEKCKWRTPPSYEKDSEMSYEVDNDNKLVQTSRPAGGVGGSEEHPIDAMAEDLINRLLVHNPVKRLGSNNNSTPFSADPDPRGHQKRNSMMSALSAISHYSSLGKGLSMDDDLSSEDSSDEEPYRDNNGPKALRNHPFFVDVAWSRLHDCECPALPYKNEFPTPSMDGASDNWLFAGDATELHDVDPISLDNSASSAKPAAGQNASAGDGGVASGQPEADSNPLQEFLYDNETIVLDGLVFKRKGLFSHTRHLILTDRPRLLYIDRKTMTFKGEIPFHLDKSQLNAVLKSNGKSLDVETPNRTYHLTDISGNAQRWVDAIHQVQQNCLESLQQQQQQQQTSS